MESRPAYTIRYADGETLDLSGSTRVMGVLNLTPDSFSDGGRHAEPGPALAAAGRMCEAGVDIIDVGGESTRPGAEIISLSIDRPDGGYILVRQGDQWLLTAPVKGPADAKQVRTILDQLRSVRAEKIVALGKTVPPQYASTEYRAVVSLGVTGLSDAKNAADTTQKPPPEKTIMKTYRLVVVKTDKGCFAWVENPAVTVVGRCSADLYDSLTGRLENSGKIVE